MKRILKKQQCFAVITILCLVSVALFAVSGCDKTETSPKHNTQGIWVCVTEHFDITLTIDNTTVGVSKSPKEMGDNDGYHQFRDGDQYLLQNDTLYLVDHFEDNVCFRPDCTFAIIKFSKDEMELEYMGMLPGYPPYMSNYLFNRKKEEQL